MKRHGLLTLLLLLSASGPVSAQLPDSPTGRAGNTVMHMFSAGAESITPGFLQATFSGNFLSATSLEDRQA